MRPRAGEATVDHDEPQLTLLAALRPGVGDLEQFADLTDASQSTVGDRLHDEIVGGATGP
ncbi:hypothetical protein GCM10009779_13690 [Polymorphospora rubra]|uniref:Uncharacterized protein n=1 Tax=Polymorphospora rubra TaxID=338584 RepID=A0A810MSZ1_9ACTN|nr:hypothetical protein Prubr_13380 [Polymorphospora rubra]